MILSKEISKLQAYKQSLIRSFENHDIEKKEYIKKHKEIEINIKSLVDKILEENRVDDSDLTINIKKIKKQKIKQQKKKIVKKETTKKVNTNNSTKSNATLIMEVLMNKEFKTIDDATKQVCKQKIGLEYKKIKSMIKTIIKETIKGKGRWRNYNWNETKFLLTNK